MVFLIETSRIQISHLPIIELSKNQSVIPYLVNMRLNGFTKGLKNVISSEGFFFFLASMREFRIEVLFIWRIKQYYCVA